jgi:twitching motility protein PilI
MTFKPSALTLVPERSPQELGEAFLKFEIGNHIQAGLLMKQVQEVVVLPAPYLTPMPNMAPEILGLMHRRSRVLWVVDLAMLLGLGALDYRPQQYDIVIVRTDTSAVAVAIRQVEGIAWIAPDALQPTPLHESSALISYVQGCVVQAQAIVFLLDGEAILRAPILQPSS